MVNDDDYMRNARKQCSPYSALALSWIAVPPTLIVALGPLGLCLCFIAVVGYFIKKVFD